MLGGGITNADAELGVQSMHKLPSQSPIEQFLADAETDMHKHFAKSRLERILADVRTELDRRAGELSQNGLSRDQAEATTVAALGPVKVWSAGIIDSIYTDERSERVCIATIILTALACILSCSFVPMLNIGASDWADTVVFVAAVALVPFSLAFAFTARKFLWRSLAVCVAIALAASFVINGMTRVVRQGSSTESRQRADTDFSQDRAGMAQIQREMALLRLGKQTYCQGSIRAVIPAALQNSDGYIIPDKFNDSDWVPNQTIWCGAFGATNGRLNAVSTVAHAASKWQSCNVDAWLNKDAAWAIPKSMPQYLSDQAAVSKRFSVQAAMLDTRDIAVFLVLFAILHLSMAAFGRRIARVEMIRRDEYMAGDTNTGPIADFIADAAKRLSRHMSDAKLKATLDEARFHLVERASELQYLGQARFTAESSAVAGFDDVKRWTRSIIEANYRDRLTPLSICLGLVGTVMMIDPFTIEKPYFSPMVAPSMFEWGILLAVMGSMRARVYRATLFAVTGASVCIGIAIYCSCTLWTQVNSYGLNMDRNEAQQTYWPEKHELDQMTKDVALLRLGLPIYAQAKPHGIPAQLETANGAFLTPNGIEGGLTEFQPRGMTFGAFKKASVAPYAVNGKQPDDWPYVYQLPDSASPTLALAQKQWRDNAQTDLGLELAVITRLQPDVDHLQSAVDNKPHFDSRVGLMILGFYLPVAFIAFGLHLFGAALGRAIGGSRLRVGPTWVQ
jgi:hypothetical protein